MDGRQVASRIKQRLEALGKSAAGASLEAGLGRSAVQNILSGASESPRTSTLQKLAIPLECSLEFLLGLEEFPPSRYMDRLSPNERTLKPFVVERVTVLECGAFRADYHSVSLELESIIGHVDLRVPRNNIEVFKLGDSTGFDEGYREDDLIFAALASEADPIRVPADGYVIVERRLPQVGLVEVSLRNVSIIRGKLILLGNSSPYGRIDIDMPDQASALFIGDEFVTDDGAVVVVKALAIRVSRGLPFGESIYGLQKDLDD